MKTFEEIFKLAKLEEAAYVYATTSNDGNPIEQPLEDEDN